MKDEKNIIQGLHSIFSERKMENFLLENQVKLIYLFGSVSKGLMSPISDIDIAVAFVPSLTEQYDKELIMGELHELLIKRKKLPYQIVELRTEAILFAYEIIKHGIVLFNHDELFRVELEANIVSRYLDFKYYIEIQNKYYLDLVDV
ncbi:MAG: type VII toxin-antitoxin system MntA family adenylyltransferase antitoxin [Candidatus Hodarchaeales archaeon]